MRLLIILRSWVRSPHQFDKYPLPACEYRLGSARARIAGSHPADTVCDISISTYQNIICCRFETDKKIINQKYFNLNLCIASAQRIELPSAPYNNNSPDSSYGSRVVPHLSTRQAQWCLTTEFGWDLVFAPPCDHIVYVLSKYY